MLQGHTTAIVPCGKVGSLVARPVMSDLWELVDICHHQEHHPRGGGLPQPKAGLKSGGKPPPPPRPYGRDRAP